MREIYYIQNNLTCFIILCIVYGQVRNKNRVVSSANKMLQLLVKCACLICLSDVVAGVCRGEMFPGARAVIEISNLIYLEMLVLTAACWLFHVQYRCAPEISKNRKLAYMMPAIVFTVVAVTNPFTNYLFSIDSSNLYSRGPGVLLHWVVTWGYLGCATVMAVKGAHSAENATQRDERRPLTLFAIAPAVASICQMLVYGVTLAQVGITISVVLIMLHQQDNLVSVDELTGINNRRALTRFVGELNKSGEQITVLMMDINYFKKINDTYGHTAGDITLTAVAGVLKNICGESRRQTFLCRYGGDEFVMVGKNMDTEQIEQLCDGIRREVSSLVIPDLDGMKLEMSMGYATGKCDDAEDFSHYIRLADEGMYEDKKRLKATRK